MNTTKKSIKSTKTPAENFSRYQRLFESKSKTRKLPKFLYDSEKERDDYNKDYERAPADWRANMERTKGFLDDHKKSAISGVFSRRLDKIRNEEWDIYEAQEDFFMACLKDPSEAEIHKIALENVDKFGSFNMKKDVHALLESHSMSTEFPREGKFTPLQIAAIMCNDALNALLNLRDKLDIPVKDKPDPNVKDSNGNTTGHLLALSCDGFGNYIREIDTSFRKMKSFLEKTKTYLDINLQNKNEDTILHLIFQDIIKRIDLFKHKMKVDDYKYILKRIDDYKKLFKKNGLNFKLKNNKDISVKKAYDDVKIHIQKKIGIDDTKKEGSKSKSTRKMSPSLSPTSPLPEEPDPKCPSKGKKPQKCKTKKSYKEQTLIFHPDRNFGCIDRATHKFKQLQNLCEDKI